MNKKADATSLAADNMNMNRENNVRPHTNCTSRTSPKELGMADFRSATQSAVNGMSTASEQRKDNFTLHIKHDGVVDDLVCSNQSSQEASLRSRPYNHTSRPKTDRAARSTSSSSSSSNDTTSGGTGNGMDEKNARGAVGQAPVLFGRRAVHNLTDDLVNVGDLGPMQRRRSRRPLGNLGGGTGHTSTGMHEETAAHRAEAVKLPPHGVQPVKNSSTSSLFSSHPRLPAQDAKEQQQRTPGRHHAAEHNNGGMLMRVPINTLFLRLLHIRIITITLISLPVTSHTETMSK